MKKVILACFSLLLAGSGSGDAQAVAAVPLPVVLTAADLERPGKLHILDRSTSLKGPDLDNNGVRDDIDRWIQKQAYTDEQKKAALQLARALQNTLSVNIADDAALRASSADMSRAVICMFDKFPDIQQGDNLIKALQKYTMNTRARTLAYLAYNQAQSGSARQMPHGNNCA